MNLWEIFKQVFEWGKVGYHILRTRMMAGFACCVPDWPRLPGCAEELQPGLSIILKYGSAQWIRRLVKCWVYPWNITNSSPQEEVLFSMIYQLFNNFSLLFCGDNSIIFSPHRWGRKIMPNRETAQLQIIGSRSTQLSHTLLSWVLTWWDQAKSPWRKKRSLTKNAPDFGIN